MAAPHTRLLEAVSILRMVHHFPHPRPFSRGEKGDNPLSLRERARVREVFEMACSRLHDQPRYFSNSGAMSFGRMSGISGQMMMAASISSIGTSMIIVSFNAKRTGTLTTAQEIIRHSP